MSNLDDFSGSVLEIPPTSIIRSKPSGSLTNCDYPIYYGNVSTALSGSMTSNVYKTGLSVTGRGVCNFIVIYANDATARTIAGKVTIDGTAVLELTGLALNAANSGMCLIGAFGSTGSLITFDQIPFRSSLLIEIRSSVTETDKMTVGYHYRLG